MDFLASHRYEGVSSYKYSREFVPEFKKSPIIIEWQRRYSPSISEPHPATRIKIFETINKSPSKSNSHLAFWEGFSLLLYMILVLPVSFLPYPYAYPVCLSAISSCTNRCLIIRIGNDNSAAGVCCMYNLTAANVDRYMVDASGRIIKQQITRLQIV